ncbi:MAG: anti-anti-sigma factor [Anaerolineaceae bacterium 4572_78]|nr:MAG: anti-anti-sigma factor [Anaerolineaceae bacterium 4572_78]
MSDEIQVEVQRLNSRTAVINLAGDVTTFAEKPITGAYKQISDWGVKNVVFNFRENDYINSAGIAILIGIVTEARKRKQRLLMAMPSSHFQKIFRMVGLTQYADIHNSIDEAINSVK